MMFDLTFQVFYVIIYTDYSREHSKELCSVRVADRAFSRLGETKRLPVGRINFLNSHFHPNCPTFLSLPKNQNNASPPSGFILCKGKKGDLL